MKGLQLLDQALRFVSFGKYETKLYHKGNSYYAHPLSGFVSLGLFSVFLYFSVVLIRDTFALTNYILSEHSYFISPAILKLGDLWTSLFNSTVILFRDRVPLV